MKTNKMQQIREALNKHDNKEGDFKDPNYTLGWIRAIAEQKE